MKVFISWSGELSKQLAKPFENGYRALFNT